MSIPEPNSIPAPEERADQSDQVSSDQPLYQSPQLVIVGKAIDLMKNDIDGHLKDGTGGWWVWGS